MEKENIVNINTLNDEQPAEDLDELEAPALKEMVLKEREELFKTKETNRQLFERAKKAEGFEKNGKGEWIKIEKKEKKSKAEKSEPNEEFGLLEKTYLRTADIIEEDEVELVKKLMEETGKGIEVIETKYFKSELEELRSKKATEKAVSDIRGGRGGVKAADSPDYWVAKGVPPTKEQVPDRKTRVKIARAMMQNASTGGKKFYND